MILFRVYVPLPDFDPEQLSDKGWGGDVSLVVGLSHLMLRLNPCPLTLPKPDSLLKNPALILDRSKFPLFFSGPLPSGEPSLDIYPFRAY